MKNKYFYPIFKLKTKSWIRYWLLKKTEFKGKLSKILTGFSFNLQNTLRQKFVKFEIQGHSIQDGEPSPENEVPIKSSGESGSITEKIVNKNLYDNLRQKTYFNASKKFVTDNSATTTDYIPANEGETYTLRSSISSQGVVIASFDKNYNCLLRSAVTGTSVSHTCPSGTKYIIGSNYAGMTANSQLELGSTATDYVPHEEQTYSIYTQQPMRSIGNVRDVFFKNTVDSPYYDENLILNGWYERHYIGEVVLNGTENIVRELIQNNVYKFYINNIENVDYGDANYVPQILCNKLIAVARTPMYLNTQGISSGNGNLQIYTDETKNMTVSEFKTWLENNKLIVNYLKTIPTNLPCTEEQIAILENLPITYEGQTNVYSTDVVVPYLKIQYWESDTNG